jgi:hypothetical protein
MFASETFKLLNQKSNASNFKRLLISTLLKTTMEIKNKRSVQHNTNYLQVGNRCSTYFLTNLKNQDISDFSWTKECFDEVA